MLIRWLPLRALAILIALVVPSCVAAVGARAASPPPTISITSPASGATVKGTVSITAQATAGSGDTMYSVNFYDGVNSIGSYSCDQQATCAATVKWQATGSSGQHTITARANAGTAHTDSTGVVVTVLTPPPTVALTAPAAGAVKGTVTLTASAATDPALDDYPSSLTFYDGVNSIGSLNCQGQQTCSGSASWKATGLSGIHALTVRVRTSRGDSATSAPVQVTVDTPLPTVSITKPSAGASLRGGTLTLAASAATDPALDDYPTSVEFFDGANRIDGFSCQGQQTCVGSIRWNTSGLKGKHTLKAVVHTNQGASATSGGVTVGSPVQIHAKPRCTLSAHHVRVGGRVRGTCTVPSARKGTKVALKYRTASGSYATALTVRTGSGGGFHFTLKASRRATYRLVVVVSANGRYLKTTASIGTLQVT
jgi:large repetitive protein